MAGSFERGNEPSAGYEGVFKSFRTEWMTK
jgi:hypothetical protein